MGDGRIMLVVVTEIAIVDGTVIGGIRVLYTVKGGSLEKP